jgi:hypothetical protein
VVESDFGIQDMVDCGLRRRKIPMSYFSHRATWLSLVESPETLGNTEGGQDIQGNPDEISLSSGWTSTPDLFEDESTSTVEDTAQLEVMRDLRHRLFFHHGEREFGPTLLLDTMRLARSQNDTEEAVIWYCQARQVAQALVEKQGDAALILAWIEIDHILAELQSVRGNFDSSAMYAREGLDIIKRNRFGVDREARVTELAVRLFRILGRDR